MKDLWQFLQSFDVIFGVVGGLIIIREGIQWLNKVRTSESVLRSSPSGKFILIGLTLIIVGYIGIALLSRYLIVFTIMIAIWSIVCLVYALLYKTKGPLVLIGTILVVYMILVIAKPWCSQELIWFTVELADTKELLVVTGSHVYTDQPNVLLKIKANPTSSFNEENPQNKFQCEWSYQSDGYYRSDDECILLYMSGADNAPDLINVKVTQFDCTQSHSAPLWINLARN